MRCQISLTCKERYVLLSLLEAVKNGVPDPIEQCGDYDVPDPFKVVNEIAEKVQSSPVIIEP